MRYYFSFVYSHIINIVNIGIDIVSYIRCYCLQCYCYNIVSFMSTLSTRFHYSARTTIMPYIVTLLGYLNFIFLAYLLTKFNVRDNNTMCVLRCYEQLYADLLYIVCCST